ncbi:hypothetical protein A6770_35035 [Nostoc minutum NIES-26]|uniref:Uncharacterized protein n=1 Tax=Nostoc minutum NIES-26 TaxID=1844469 RepID=A0A367S2Z6_9NOSO|nr:hypothetical protein A6770_35035 [Nostoc minutum NIES-26]
MSNNGNSNGNHNNSQTSTANGVESSELGEVKIALGRLYKEFESFKQSQKTERERDRAELQAWAQTNLIQNQLLSKAMVTIEMLTGELKNQNLSWKEFEQSNETLKQELTHLLSQSQSISKSSSTLESLEFKGLKSEIQELKSNWNDLLIHTNKLTTVIQELKNSPPPKPITIEKEVYRSEPIGKYGTMGLFTALFTLSIFLVFNQFIPVKISDDIHNYLQGIWQRTGYTNVKLQRVEKRLRTDPNQR